MNESLRRTPLYKSHCALKARLVPYAGWEMPVSYSGILEEVRAVRTGAGLFDISHMGRLRVSGVDSLDLLQRLTTNDVSTLTSGQAQYSLITNTDGGIIDDIIVYRQADRQFLVVLNASNTEKDIRWIAEHAGPDVTLEDRTTETAMIAVQGPHAPALVERITGLDLSAVGRFSFVEVMIGKADVALCRTGYTGEDGFEIITPAAEAADLWDRLVAEGGVPCGLGARDALRIEAGYPLYGHEIDDSTTPVEAALMWVVSLNKGEFTGRDVIAKTKAAGAGCKLVGLHLKERIVPRQGYNLFKGEALIGSVTSGIFSPTTGHSIGMAYVDDPHNKPGTDVEVEIRSNRFPAVVIPKKDLLKP